MGETYTRGLLQNRLVLNQRRIEELPYCMLGIVALPLDWLVVSYKAGIIPLAVTDVSG
jgi:hypothetical protein